MFQKNKLIIIDYYNKDLVDISIHTKFNNIIILKDNNAPGFIRNKTKFEKGICFVLCKSNNKGKWNIFFVSDLIDKANEINIESIIDFFKYLEIKNDLDKILS